MAVEKVKLNDLRRRVDAMMAELAMLREELHNLLLDKPTERRVADSLYGILGHGAPEEYDLMADWERFM